MRRGPVVRMVVALALLAAASQPAGATVVLPVDVHGLIDRSAVIFVGTVVHQEVALTGDGAFPFTLVTFRVERLLKGSNDLGELTIALPGGAIGEGDFYVIEGAPEFVTGERYVVFARGNGVRGFPIVGWRQGVLRLVRDGRSGEQIATDADGRPIRGLAGAEWVKQAAPGDAAPAGIQVLGTNGVAITEPAPAVAAPAAPVPAERVLGALGSAIRARSGAATFLPPAAVASARPEDLPFTMTDRPEVTP